MAAQAAEDREYKQRQQATAEAARGNADDVWLTNQRHANTGSRFVTKGDWAQRTRELLDAAKMENTTLAQVEEYNRQALLDQQRILNNLRGANNARNMQALLHAGAGQRR